MFYDGSNYDYHFIIKKTVEVFEDQFQCLEENTKKCTTFSVSINKENKKGKTITCKIKLIDSGRFIMSSLLSSLADILAEGLQADKCKYCKSDLEYVTTKDGSLILKCIAYKKNYEKEFDGNLATRFQNSCKFCDRDIK